MSDSWQNIAAPMSARRHSHSQTLLQSGIVLIAGGAQNGDHTGPLGSAELYYPGARTFIPAPGAMKAARFMHDVAVLRSPFLVSGAPLVAGGFEVFDPLFVPALTCEVFVGGSFSSAAAVNQEQTVVGAPFALTPPGAAALWGVSPKVLVTVLGNGSAVPPAFPPTQVQLPTLVVFKQVAGAPALNQYSVNPVTKVVTFNAGNAGNGVTIRYAYRTSVPGTLAPGPMITPRGGHALVTLPDGRVLAVGGLSSLDPGNVALLPEVYDPTLGIWTELGALSVPRFIERLTAVLRQDGRVMMTGGWDKIPTDPTFNNTNLRQDSGVFDWILNLEALEVPMVVQRAHHCMVLLKDNRVLACGGAAQFGGQAGSEVFDPRFGGFWKTAGLMSASRSGIDPQRLEDGRVIIAGGSSAGLIGSIFGGPDPETVDIFHPDTDQFVLGPPMPIADGVASLWYRSTLLPDGTVLFAGGSVNDLAVDRAALFVPG